MAKPRKPQDRRRRATPPPGEKFIWDMSDAEIDGALGDIFGTLTFTLAKVAEQHREQVVEWLDTWQWEFSGE